VSMWSKFVEPAEPAHPAVRYGMLALILVLLAWNIHLFVTLTPGYSGDPYMNGVVVLMLLFNHVAYQFKWPHSATAALRILAWIWLALGLFYIFYLSRVLYPIGD
jgi:hypothetical protein